jgi:hypothetical protein
MRDYHNSFDAVQIIKSLASTFPPDEHPRLVVIGTFLPARGKATAYERKL